MDPRMRRLLPLILIVALVIFVLPQLFSNKSSGGSVSGKDKGAITLDAINRIDLAERRYHREHGKYTDNLADLVASDRKLADDLAIDMDVEIDVGENGDTYLVRASTDVLGASRSRTGTKVIDSCRKLKSSEAKCPELPPATTTATTPTTSE